MTPMIDTHAPRPLDQIFCQFNATVPNMSWISNSRKVSRHKASAESTFVKNPAKADGIG